MLFTLPVPQEEDAQFVAWWHVIYICLSLSSGMAFTPSFTTTTYHTPCHSCTTLKRPCLQTRQDRTGTGQEEFLPFSHCAFLPACHCAPCLATTAHTLLPACCTSHYLLLHTRLPTLPPPPACHLPTLPTRLPAHLPHPPACHTFYHLPTPACTHCTAWAGEEHLPAWWFVGTDLWP